MSEVSLAAQSSKWDSIINQFDPWTAVSGEQLQTLFVEREYSAWQRLRLSLRPERIQHKVLLSGQRGCGKTSELLKLASEVQDDYLTVYVDLFQSLDLTDTSRVELLVLFGAAIYKAAQEADVKVPARLWKELFSSMSTVVREQTSQKDFALDAMAILSTVVCTAGIVYPPLAEVGRGMRDSFRLGLGFNRKEIERLEQEPILREVMARVNAIALEVQQAAGKPLLLLADGLDKVGDPSQAELIFARSWTLTAVGCRVVYAAPVTLVYSPLQKELQNYFESVDIPNVRLYEKGTRDVLYQPGLNVMQTVVERRLGTIGLTVADVFDPDALDHLIPMSGGIMRDMMELVRNAITEAEILGEARVSVKAAGQAIHRMSIAMQRGLTEQHYRALLEFERSGGLINGEDRYQLDLLMNGYVIGYENGGFWRGIHPIIAPVVSEYTATRPTLSSTATEGPLDHVTQRQDP